MKLKCWIQKIMVVWFGYNIGPWSLTNYNCFLKKFFLFPQFQIFTYVVIAMGFTLFFSGLIGWVGGASESPCLVRLFLFTVILSIVAEIGGIITLNIIKTQVNNFFMAKRSSLLCLYCKQELTILLGPGPYTQHFIFFITYKWAQKARVFVLGKPSKRSVMYYTCYWAHW